MLDDEYVRRYIEFAGPVFVEHRRQYPLAKVLGLAVRYAGCGSVGEFVEKFRRDSGGLHIVMQAVVNELSLSLAPKTVWFYITLLTNFLDFYDVDVSRARRKVRLPKNAAAKTDRIPSTAELQKIILGTKSRRLSLLLQLCAQTGLRLGEALKLKKSYVDLENKVIKIPATITKNGKAREVFICSELEESLKNYLQRNTGSEWLFPAKDPRKHLHKARVHATFYATLKRLGLDERDGSGLGHALHIHTLRKWFKTTLETAGVNRLLIEEWMGHSTGVQGVYYKPPPDVARREFFEKADPALRIFGKVETKAEEVEDLKARVEVLEMYLKALTGEELGKVYRFTSQKYGLRKT